MRRFEKSMAAAQAAAVLAAVWIFAGGCTTGGPSVGEISNALSVINHGVETGVVAWQQYEALKAATKEVEASCEVDPLDGQQAVDAAIAGGTWPGIGGTVGTTGGTTGGATPVGTPVVIPATIANTSGKALAVILGNRTTCSYCKKLWVPGLEAAVEAALPGVDVIDADKDAHAALYAGYRPSGGFAYPFVIVIDKDGRRRGTLVARNLSAVSLAARIRELCPDCAEPPVPRADAAARTTAPDSRARAVVCGLARVDPAAYRGWKGDCPGSDVDAQVFAAACESNGVGYELLLNAGCTAANIERAARAATARMAPGGVLILYLSGHGGQQAASGPEPEADGKDETLCLWDGPLTDNAVWRLLCQVPPGIRIWMVTDTCHSGTNYRGVHDYAGSIKARFGGDVNLYSTYGPWLLHWGGCADGQYSYGTAQGGTFTTALVDAYAHGQSYADWFAAAQRLMPASQRPTCETVGFDFRVMPAFE